MNDQVVQTKKKQTELDAFERGTIDGLRYWLMDIHASLDLGPAREVVGAMALQLHRIAHHLDQMVPRKDVW